MMINKITKYLDELYPNPICELEYSKDYELLLAIVIFSFVLESNFLNIVSLLPVTFKRPLKRGFNVFLS